MNNKFQEILATPAIVVPGMTTEEIHITLLEASLEYVKKNINLETLTLLASKIHYFLGMRGKSSIHIENMISQITEFTDNQQAGLAIDAMLLDSATKFSQKAYV